MAQGLLVYVDGASVGTLDIGTLGSQVMRVDFEDITGLTTHIRNKSIPLLHTVSGVSTGSGGDTKTTTKFIAWKLPQMILGKGSALTHEFTADNSLIDILGPLTIGIFNPVVIVASPGGASKQNSSQERIDESVFKDMLNWGRGMHLCLRLSYVDGGVVINKYYSVPDEINGTFSTSNGVSFHNALEASLSSTAASPTAPWDTSLSGYQSLYGNIQPPVLSLASIYADIDGITTADKTLTIYPEILVGTLNGTALGSGSYAYPIYNMGATGVFSLGFIKSASAKTVSLANADDDNNPETYASTKYGWLGLYDTSGEKDSQIIVTESDTA